MNTSSIYHLKTIVKPLIRQLNAIEQGYHYRYITNKNQHVNLELCSRTNLAIESDNGGTTDRRNRWSLIYPKAPSFQQHGAPVARRSPDFSTLWGMGWGGNPLFVGPIFCNRKSQFCNPRDGAITVITTITYNNHLFTIYKYLKLLNAATAGLDAANQHIPGMSLVWIQIAFFYPLVN